MASSCLVFALLLAVACALSSKGHSGPYWDGNCDERWFLEDLHTATEQHDWQLKYTELDVSVFSRESASGDSNAWLFKAHTPHLPVPVSRLRQFLYEDFYNKEHLAVWYPRFLEGWIVRQFSNHSAVVYEIHDRYRTLTFPRDYVLARCLKELDDGGFVLSFRSVRHPDFPEGLEFSRSFYPRLAFVVRPSPSDAGASQLTLVEQEEIECCVPQKGLDQHRPYSLTRRLLAIRKLLGGRGRCIGDRTREDYDFVPSCHLSFHFRGQSCDQVLAHIRQAAGQKDPQAGKYRLNQLTSDESCIELYHDGWLPYGEDVHFEPIYTHSEAGCHLQARSRSRVIWGFDSSINYCNIINLVKDLGNYNVSLGQPVDPGTIFECMYRPGHSEDPIKACSASTRTWHNTLCSLDVFKVFC